jgi:hypothetical protein
MMLTKRALPATAPALLPPRKFAAQDQLPAIDKRRFDGADVMGWPDAEAPYLGAELPNEKRCGFPITLKIEGA